MARPIHSNKFSNPDDLLRKGTPGFRPPEQVLNPDTPADEDRVSCAPGKEIGEKAMVFSFAASVFRVSLSSILYRKQFLGCIIPYYAQMHGS